MTSPPAFLSDFDTDVVCGEKYRDEQTGIEGVATSVHFYQHACERVTLEYVHDGQLMIETFDRPRLTRITFAADEAKPEPKLARTGGPARAGEGRRGTPTR